MSASLDDTGEFSPQVEMWHREEVASTPDDSELVRRWFKSLKVDKRGRLLIAVVCEVFEVGSVAAATICRRHGYDRDAWTIFVIPPAGIRKGI